jgi:hypothetical protein
VIIFVTLKPGDAFFLRVSTARFEIDDKFEFGRAGTPRAFRAFLP